MSSSVAPVAALAAQQQGGDELVELLGVIVEVDEARGGWVAAHDGVADRSAVGGDGDACARKTPSPVQLRWANRCSTSPVTSTNKNHFCSIARG